MIENSGVGAQSLKYTETVEQSFDTWVLGIRAQIEKKKTKIREKSEVMYQGSQGIIFLMWQSVNTGSSSPFSAR